MTARNLQPAPAASSARVRRLMQANRSRDTGPERSIRAALWKTGIKGYRLDWKKAPGKPDIAFVRKRVAVFIMGCFWHRCPRCSLSHPKTNSDWWRRKFERNTKRDNNVRRMLEEIGWTVVPLWECEVREDIQDCISRIVVALKKSPATSD